jgi:hypothetical protein
MAIAIARGASMESGQGASRGTRSGRVVALFALGSLSLLFGAGPALALDAIDLSPTRAAAADGDTCPELTRIKYPWSDCGKGFALGFTEGEFGEPPASQCRLYLRGGICAATTQPWGDNYLGYVPDLAP